MTPLHVYGGLCNRLRTILSWRSAVYDDLVVAWIPDGEIHHERYEDAFRPLSKVTFVDAPEPTWPKRLDVHPNAPSNWIRGWLDVDLRDSPPEVPGPYAAIHMRRTDCVYMQKEERTWEPDESFARWCSMVPGDIYLATDNGQTQAVMSRAIEAMGKRPITYASIQEHERQNEGGVRNTSLRHAWCDVLACARATQFKGSGSSSFTHTIETLRRMG